MVGVDTGVFHGFVNCGAGGAITGIGNALPKEVLHLVAFASARRQAIPRRGSRRRSWTRLSASSPPSTKGPILVLYYKHLLVLLGDDAYRLHFNETDRLSDSQRNYVEQQFNLFRTWYTDWSRQPGVVSACA